MSRHLNRSAVAAMTPDEARVTVLGVPDVQGKNRQIFSAIAERKI